MGDRASRLPWLGAAAVAAVASSWAMFQEVTTFGRPGPVETGLDFANNTWRAVRGLLAGTDIYAPTHAVIPGIGPGWPVSPHVPGSLLWQAPFAALPLRAAVFSYAFASILAIWAAVFLITRPRQPAAVLLTACCGGFAICTGAGTGTLLLGQPTGFMLLGLAMVVRIRRPWLAGLGLALAASTIQTGLPLALALVLLGAWPVVWRGITLLLASSLPPILLGIASQGLRGFVRTFVTGGVSHLGRPDNRIDLGALLQRLGVASAAVVIGAGLLAAALALAFLARLPAHLRQIDHPPVLFLVIAFTLLCTYHEAYDMLLVSGAVVPVILVNDRSRAMLPVFALAGISAGIAGYAPGSIADPLALLAIGLLSALAARRGAAAAGSNPAAPACSLAPLSPAVPETPAP